MNLSIRTLPVLDSILIGRDLELSTLEEAWTASQTNVIQIVGPRGTGKTALMSSWYRRHLGEAPIFGWSFYSQGISDKNQTSSDLFFAAAIRFFNITLPSETVPLYGPADALIERLREERVLLLVDGVELLQDATGAIKDQPFNALLQDLSTRNQGLMLCTTRVRLPGIAHGIELENLHPDHGAEYLRYLGIQGDDGDLRDASMKCGNHALTLTLASALHEIPVFSSDKIQPAELLDAIGVRFRGQPELDVLQALGYFDRPADREALKLLLLQFDDATYQAAITHLQNVRLLRSSDPDGDIDCHPLVREHFTGMLRATDPRAWRGGHGRLYQHYCRRAPDKPDTLADMTPLCHAVYHGCQAGRHHEALNSVYFDRIRRGPEFYLTGGLGAFGTNLWLLANFFRSLWTEPVPTLSPTDQAALISNTNFDLQAAGRLNDAVEPMTKAAEGLVTGKDWANAARDSGSLSELHLLLGNIGEAIKSACGSVDCADRSGDLYLRMSLRTVLGDALHQAGRLAEAARVFQEAERLQAEWQPEHPILYGVRGNRYCELLISQGKVAEALRRATQSLAIVEPHGWLPDIGLDKLSLGRLDEAVDCLRRYGDLKYLLRALLARGTPRDLDDVLRVASRSGMRLLLAKAQTLQKGPA